MKIDVPRLSVAFYSQNKENWSDAKIKEWATLRGAGK